MLRDSLTDISIRNLKVDLTDRYEVFDVKVPGFGVRVFPSGIKSFVLLYRTNGRPRRLTLGRYPVLSLAEARKLARQRLAKLIIDDNRIEFSSSATFRETVDSFLDKHCSIRNKPRTAGETERLLKRHWLPVFSRRMLPSTSLAN